MKRCGIVPLTIPKEPRQRKNDTERQIRATHVWTIIKVYCAICLFVRVLTWPLACHWCKVRLLSWSMFCFENASVGGFVQNVLILDYNLALVVLSILITETVAKLSPAAVTLKSDYIMNPRRKLDQTAERHAHMNFLYILQSESQRFGRRSIRCNLKMFKRTRCWVVFSRSEKVLSL